LRGDGQKPNTLVSKETQQKALDAVLQTLSSETLTIPESIIQLIPARPAGYWPSRELFKNVQVVLLTHWQQQNLRLIFLSILITT
jgi:hypothetical protein